MSTHNMFLWGNKKKIVLWLLLLSGSMLSCDISPFYKMYNHILFCDLSFTELEDMIRKLILLKGA